MKKIHFILPGGGVKGSFQAGFLYELNKSAESLYTIGRIDGTSVGALNGYAFALNEIEELYEIWNTIDTISDVFDNYINVPYLSNISSGYNLIQNYGLYNNNTLLKKIEKLYTKDMIITDTDHKSSDLLNHIADIDEKKRNREQLLEKFNCVVTCIREGTYKYINGTNTNITKYITASASPWIISNPIEIDEDLFTDGGLLHTFPTDYINKEEYDLTMIVGYDSMYNTTNGHEGTNTLNYLGRLIDIVRLNTNNINNINNLITSDNENLVIIENSMKIDFLDFNKKAISEGFTNGREQAKQFIEKYLNI